MKKKLLMEELILLIILVVACVIPSSAQLPGTPTIYTDKNEYDKWETVQVVVEADAHPNVEYIHEFLLHVTYGKSGVDPNDLEITIPAYNVDGLKYRGEYEFELVKGDVYVYIEACAFDAPASSGGLPSGFGDEKVIFSRQAYDWNEQDGESSQNGDKATLNLVLVAVILILVVIIFSIIIIRHLKK